MNKNRNRERAKVVAILLPDAQTQEQKKNLNDKKAYYAAKRAMDLIVAIIGLIVTFIGRNGDIGSGNRFPIPWHFLFMASNFHVYPPYIC